MEPTIQPVEIGLLKRHGDLPDPQAVLGRFSEFYRATLEQAQAEAVAHETVAPVVVEAQEAVADVADFAELAADARAQGFMEGDELPGLAVSEESLAGLEDAAAEHAEGFDEAGDAAPDAGDAADLPDVEQAFDAAAEAELPAAWDAVDDEASGADAAADDPDGAVFDEPTFLRESDPGVSELLHGQAGAEDVAVEDTYASMVEAGDAAAAEHPTEEVPASDAGFDPGEAGAAIGEDARAAEWHENMEGHHEVHDGGLVDQADVWAEAGDGDDLIAGDFIDDGGESTLVEAERPAELADDDAAEEGTVMMQAFTGDLDEEPAEEGTAMMAAMPDDDEESADEGTVMMQALPDDFGEDAAGQGELGLDAGAEARVDADTAVEASPDAAEAAPAEEAAAPEEAAEDKPKAKPKRKRRSRKARKKKGE